MSEAPRDPVTGEGAAIRFDAVTKGFGDQTVLDAVDLVIPEQQITCVIGRSGSGKSVSLKLAAGLLEPDDGLVWVGDRDMTSTRESDRKEIREALGVVFQHGALFDSMTVYDNVAFPLREHTDLSDDEISERVDEVLNSVGLPGTQDKLPEALSGGMQKRVALARALSRGPSLLFYDEPTTGLDPILSREMHELIRTTHDSQEGTTTLLISHDIARSFEIADKIVFIMNQAIRCEGTPDELARTDDEKVREFLEASNVLNQ